MRLDIEYSMHDLSLCDMDHTENDVSSPSNFVFNY